MEWPQINQCFNATNIYWSILLLYSVNFYFYKLYWFNVTLFMYINFALQSLTRPWKIFILFREVKQKPCDQCSVRNSRSVCNFTSLLTRSQSSGRSTKHLPTSTGCLCPWISDLFCLIIHSQSTKYRCQTLMTFIKFRLFLHLSPKKKKKTI